LAGPAKVVEWDKGRARVVEWAEVVIVNACSLCYKAECLKKSIRRYVSCQVEIEQGPQEWDQ